MYYWPLGHILWVNCWYFSFEFVFCRVFILLCWVYILTDLFLDLDSFINDFDSFILWSSIGSVTILYLFINNDCLLRSIVSAGSYLFINLCESDFYRWLAIIFPWFCLEWTVLGDSACRDIILSFFIINVSYLLRHNTIHYS